MIELFLKVPVDAFIIGLNNKHSYSPMNDVKNTEKISMQPKRAAVVVGRFNPPTIGHYKVIDTAKAFVRDNKNLRLDPVIIVVVVDGVKSSEDKNRNPLTADERVAFMTGSELANGVKFLIAPSAMAAFQEVRKAGYEPIAVAAGADRGDNYLKMLDTYFKTDDDKPIDHYLIGLDRGADAVQESVSPKKNIQKILQLTRNINCPQKDLVHAVEENPVITAKILDAINAAHDSAVHITSVSQAIAQLGFNTVKNIALKMCQHGVLEGLDNDAALDDILKYTDNEIPVTMVSASLARHAVKNDELDKFTIITGLQKKPALAKLMFNKIKAAMATMKPEADEDGESTR